MAIGHAEARILAPPAQQGADLARWIRQVRADPARRAPRPAERAALRAVVVTGGKGGVGKSNFSLNFSLALQARGRRVLLVDCDNGLGNLDVLLGLAPARHLGHVLCGACAVEEALVPGPLGLSLLPAASGLDAVGRANAVEVGRLIGALGRLAYRYDLCVLDSGAGLGAQVRAILRTAGEIVLVTTPEPTALTDAYATLKVIRHDNPGAQTRLVVNMADTARDAEIAVASVSAVSRQFLDWTPGYLGFVPRDAAVQRAVRRQQPFLLHAPGCAAAQGVRTLAAVFCDDPARAGGRGRGLREILLSLVGSRPGGEAVPGASGPPAGASPAEGQAGPPGDRTLGPEARAPGPEPAGGGIP